MTKRLLTAAIFFAASTALFAQNHLRLLMKDGVHEIAKGDFSGFADDSPAFDAVSQTYYGILHYETPPVASEVDRLEKAGVHFDYVLPVNAFLVSVPATALPLQHSASSFYPIPAASKISERISSQDYPEWMWKENGKAEVALMVMRGSKWQESLERIRQAGFSIAQEDAIAGSVIARGFLPYLSNLFDLPFIHYIAEADQPGEPENDDARVSHRVETVQQWHPTYDGRDVVVGVGDDGSIGPHIDYQGRIIIDKAGASQGNHGDHVSGTVFGAGNLDPRGMGMAPGAELVYYQNTTNGHFQDIDQDYVNLGVRIHNTSYSGGCNSGYTSLTNQMDVNALQHRSLLHVFSAGNNGASPCGNAYIPGQPWGNITGGHKMGKNVIATANIRKEDVVAGSSSKGPATDGRIKPDISAVGTNVFSTYGGNIYSSISGTSMASPGIVGCLAVMYSAYKQNNGNVDPAGGLMKNILMNTADDLWNEGPDFVYGYGRVNTKNAVEVIENAQYMLDTVSNSQSNTHSITVPSNVAQLKVMVYWVDPAASPASQRNLVNNLDMTLTTPGGSTFLPWVLDPRPNVGSVTSPAVRAVDTLNNAEQITIDDPSAGTYTIDITGTNIPLGVQEYFISYHFIEDEIEVDFPMTGVSLRPFQQNYVRWTAPEGTGNFTIEYSPDDGQNWFNLTSSVSSSESHYDWSGPPASVTHEARIRVSRGGQSGISGKFSVIAVANNIQVVAACPDSVLLTWDPVSGATHYDVMRLGNRYMDSVITVSTNQATLTNVNPVNDEWFSVRPRRDSTIVGQRSVAIFKPAGVFNCAVNEDLEVAEILNPSYGLQDCQSSSVVPMARVVNNGIQAAFNFDVWMSFSGPAGSGNQSITISDTIQPGDFMDVALTNTWNIPGGTYDVEAVVTKANDGNPFNDSLQSEVLVSFASGIRPFPYTNDLDGFINCPTASNCNGTSCPLPDGFQNLPNNIVGGDNIDWRVNNGPTPSNNTGPAVDHSTGSASGKYLYLEASGGCEEQLAVLTSPCIDLANAIAPRFGFWYHMNGSNMGELHVDVVAGGRTYVDIVPPISGNQGNQWLPLEINLSPFVGQIINIRIRGITGDDFTSDIAIDDFEWTEVNSAPSVSFSPTQVQTCTNTTVEFLDLSSNAASQWEWKFFPNTVSFVGGTNANSQNPRVQFNQAGTYDVRLIASNAFGIDSLTEVGAVSIPMPQPVAIIQDFENLAAGWPPSGYSVVNPDNDDTWERAFVSSATTSGQNSRVMTVNNFNYNEVGEEDWFVTPSISMPAAGNIYLRWDIAYAYYSASFSDGFEVRLSTDCGQSFPNVLYSESGSDLATAGAQTSNWSPNGPSDWRGDSINMAAYLGQEIQLAFVNINGYGNNIFIDNIRVYEPGVTAPTSAAFTQSDTATCTGNTVSFSALNPPAGMNYTWDFGSGSTPNMASGSGPHQVTYSSAGNKSVVLTATNTAGSVSENSTVDVTLSPTANFNYSTGATFLDYQFNNTSVAGGSPSYTWDFGDGNNSSLQNPTHTYAAPGVYTVSLTTVNSCGSDVRFDTINVSGISLNESTLVDWRIYPNPANEELNVEMNAGIEKTELRVLDIRGRVMTRLDLAAAASSVRISLNDWAPGVYIIELVSTKGVLTKRFVKE